MRDNFIKLTLIIVQKNNKGPVHFSVECFIEYIPCLRDPLSLLVYAMTYDMLYIAVLLRAVITTHFDKE